MAGADAVRVSGGVLGVHVLEGDVASGVGHVAPDPVGTHKVGRLHSAHILISKCKLESKNLAFLLVPPWCCGSAARGNGLQFDATGLG